MHKEPVPNYDQKSSLHIQVMGQIVDSLPQDLYIPPEALMVFLDLFEGPLDFLLYLIRKQNLDIINIPIAEITNQYMQYIEVMREMKFELAADYLLMAATLAEIKSRMLLPRSKNNEEEDDIDPRADLIKRLQEYERFKLAANLLDELPRQERDLHYPKPNLPDWDIERTLPKVNLSELLLALKEVMNRAEINSEHAIKREVLSVRERMSQVLSILADGEFVDFKALFPRKEGKAGAIVTFLAILELAKESMIEIVQSDAFAPIHLRTVS